MKIKKHLPLLALAVTMSLTCACAAPTPRVVYQTIETTPHIIHITATPTPTLPPPTPVKTAIPRLAATCGEDGDVRTFNIDTSAPNDSIRFQVYLPPCYEQQPTAHYPVVYLLHGAGRNLLAWNQNGAAETANRMIRDGQIPPFILVTPNLFKVNDDKCTTVVRDLVPHVDGHFRTLPDPQYRGVGGASSGGFIAACMSFQFPGQFGNVGVFGGGLFDERTPRFNGWITATPPQQHPRVLIDLGAQDDMRPFTNVLTRTLAQRDVPYTLVIEPGGHSYEYWAGHLEMYYRWFAESW